MSLSHSFAVLDELLSCLDEEHAHAVVEHRRFTIKKPLTVYAAKLLAKRFAEWGDANQAADIMIEKAWQGFDPAWIKDRARPNGKRTIVDAAISMIGRSH